MYQDIINFLLGRKKKLLSKEDADHLIRLIAQSIGLQDEYKEKCDDKYVIKRILDNVVLEEENNYDDTLCEDIGDIFDFDEYIFDDEYSECSDNLESIDEDKPLSKRKIKRRNAFNSSKRKHVEEEENTKVSFSEEKNPMSCNSEDIKASNKTDGPDTCGDTFSFKLPPTNASKFVFDPPKEKEDEFTFNIGELSNVKNEGPKYEFFDDDGRPL